MTFKTTALLTYATKNLKWNIFKTNLHATYLFLKNIQQHKNNQQHLNNHQHLNFCRNLIFIRFIFSAASRPNNSSCLQIQQQVFIRFTYSVASKYSSDLHNMYRFT